jgi:hypothetical protein
MAYKSNHSSSQNGSVSVLGFDISTLGLFSAKQNSTQSTTYKKSVSKDFVYRLQTLLVDDELHLFSDDGYVVLRKTDNSFNLEFRNSKNSSVDTEVRFLGISIAPNDFYKKDDPGVFIGGWLHLAECITFRPDKLSEIPKGKLSLIGDNFVVPEKLPLSKLEQNIRNGNIIVGRDKKPYYQLIIPSQKELVFGPITDIVLI